MKEKLSIQTEIDYLKWITTKRKTIRRVLVKNKMRLMFGFISTPPTTLNKQILPYLKDYWL